MQHITLLNLSCKSYHHHTEHCYTTYLFTWNSTLVLTNACTVTARSTACRVFYRSSIWTANRTRINACNRHVFLSNCAGKAPATDWSKVQAVLRNTASVNKIQKPGIRQEKETLYFIHYLGIYESRNEVRKITYTRPVLNVIYRYIHKNVHSYTKIQRRHTQINIIHVWENVHKKYTYTQTTT